MSADKQRDQYLVKHLILPDNHLSHLGKNAIAHRLKAFHALLQLCCVLVQFCSDLHRLASPSNLVCQAY